MAKTNFLTDDEIFGYLVEIQTGKFKIENQGLYTKIEENSPWLYCGKVNAELVYQIWDSIVED